MCFSPQASFTAGAALSIVGAATMISATKNRDKNNTAAKTSDILFAAIPLLFAAQQITEGFVWLSLDYHWAFVQTVATYIYALFAYVWWPLFVPLAVGLLENVAWRKRAIYLLGIFGIAAGGYLLYYIVEYPILAHVVNSCIAYRIVSPLNVRPYVAACYIIAALGPFFLSSRRLVNIFGVAAAVSLAITYFFFRVELVSVWCFFAAILSGIIYFYFFRKSR